MITLLDINDDLLRPIGTEPDIAWATEKMNELADSMDTTIGTLSRAAIDLAHAYVCIRIAERKAGAVAPKVIAEGVVFDMYESKRRYYAKTIDALLASITDSDLNSGTKNKSAGIPRSTPFSMPLRRG